MIPDETRNRFCFFINNRFFYGWVMLAVGAIGLFVSGPAQSHTFSVFVTPISDGLGISRSAVSTAYATATLLAALGLPFVGRLVDRYGVRTIMLLITLFFGAAVAAFGFVNNLILLAVGFSTLRFLGQGSLMLSSYNLLAQWFSQKRGFAIGVMSLGFSLSMALHPLVAQYLIDSVGWRESWIWLGIGTWILFLPCVFLLVQNRPEDIGLLPDGASEILKEAAPEPRVHGSDTGLTLSEAMQTSAFWICACASASLSLLVTAMFFHQVSILSVQGIPPQTASKIFSISAFTMVVSMPVAGKMLDRFPTRLVFAISLIIMSVAMICLAAVTDTFSAILYGIIFGVANAGSHTLMAFIWPRFFGRRHLGSIQGAAQMATVIGASVGPIPFGVAWDLFESYTEALIAVAVLPILCAVAVLFIKEPRLRN